MQPHKITSVSAFVLSACITPPVPTPVMTIVAPATSYLLILRYYHNNVRAVHQMLKGSKYPRGFQTWQNE
jgi:hypothetical protein